MADVWVLLLILAFFATCVGLVRGCDRIIGGDAVDAAEPSAADAGEPETAGAER